MFITMLVLLISATWFTGMAWITNVNSQARLTVFGVSALLLTMLLISRI